jgi:hypothetical protein
MIPPEDEALVEEAASAFRADGPGGAVRSHPAWHDLNAEGRARAFKVARTSRALEAALDPEGLSTTVRAVLARIQRPR